MITQPDIQQAQESWGRDTHFPENGGFPLEPWTSVTFDNAGLTRPNKSPGGVALAMGNYFFGRADGSELKAENSFAYVRGSSDLVKI
jgi:hypothetical protein